MLYSFNSYSAICQQYSHKTGKIPNTMLKAIVFLVCLSLTSVVNVINNYKLQS